MTEPAGPLATAPAESQWQRVVGPPQGRWGLGAAVLCLLPIFALTAVNAWYVAANPDSADLDLQGGGQLLAWVVVISVAAGSPACARCGGRSAADSPPSS
jgi:hypothetical protein